MKRYFVLLTILITLIVLFPIRQRAERQSQGQPPRDKSKQIHPNIVPGEILVRFRPGSKGKRLGRQVVTEKTGRQIPLSIEAVSPAGEIVDGLRIARVNAADTSSAIEALRARLDVIYAEPSLVRKKLATPNDPRYAEMWGLNNTGQQVTLGGNLGVPGNDIRAPQAWNITTGSRSVVVGVVDTGIDINHVDLHDNIWTNPAEIPGNGIDDDGNGFVDDVHGWDFAHNDASVFDYTEPTFPPAPSYTGDFDDHGTHVAGTIGATGNNGIGVTGVNWQVSILPLKFLTDDGAGSSTDLLKALTYAKSMKQLWDSSGGTKGANIRVLNNSYGGVGFSQAELDAIRAMNDLGILFVAAAGNESVSNDLYPVYPANYISPNVISVAASSGGGIQTSFTNFGGGTVNVTAPGEYILSTMPKNTYDFAKGTSMAAPHVSGTAALVCALSPNITVQKLRAVMMYSGYVAPWQYTDDFPISTGRAVDAGKALQTLSTTDVTPPGAINNLNAQNNTFPNYTLMWQAPGDDGNVGRIAAYDVRFSDVSLNDANFELGSPLPGPVPGDPGTTQFVQLKIPWRHPSGFLGVRGVDEAGNKGPISQVPISVSPGIGDPYVMTESAVAPLSTGGTALGMIGDDVVKNVNLPFLFRYYGIDYSSVWVSTNGALYFGLPRNDDAFSSERWVNGHTMIAGLWDDLRTDRRAGDDVYMVQDADRILFRWQAVTYDTQVSPTVTRGENPVSFEIELRYDGTITVRYGGVNQKVFPIVGIGGGSPEPYMSTSHTSEFSFKDLSNASTVIYTRRNPMQRGVLTVASSNPTSGVNITVSPNDISNAGNGTTQFTRTYNPGTTVTLTAPATVNGNNFRVWQRDGQDWSGTVSTDLVMNGDHTMTAVYSATPVLTLTVNSTSPNSGVNISVSPNDSNGAGNGTTPFTRTYTQTGSVNLTAPLTVGTSTFWKWKVDGVDYVQSQLATITLNVDHTATAVYITPSPTPTPTPVPGAGAQPIAFVKQVSPSAGFDVFLTNTDGSNIVNLTNTQGDDLKPAWSPDGTRLAYTCFHQPDGSLGGPQRICVRNADGTGFASLSNSLFADEFGPAWSRDGNRIAFTSFTPGFPTLITIMNADGSGRNSLANFSGAADPDWSVDNGTLIFDLNNSIWTYNFQTQTGLRLTNSTGDSLPHYSPNGSKVVFQSTRDGQAEIYVMNPDGTGQTRLTNNPAGDMAPAWSPDGTKILFTSLRDDPMNAALYVMNADGSNQTRLTNGSNGTWRGSTTPVIYLEEGTTNAAALTSVTYLRGPFQLLDPYNFSVDGHTRLTLFTSNLALISPPVPTTSTLSVQANGVNLPVENVGPITGMGPLTGSYIIVRLPDGLAKGNLSLTITVRGVTSAATTLQIAQ